MRIASAKNDAEAKSSSPPPPSSSLMVVQNLNSLAFFIRRSSISSRGGSPGKVHKSAGKHKGKDDGPGNGIPIVQEAEQQHPPLDGKDAAEGVGIFEEEGLRGQQEYVTLGPLWAGPIYHPDFVAAVIHEVRLSHGANADALPRRSRPAFGDGPELSASAVPATVAVFSKAGQVAERPVGASPAVENYGLCRGYGDYSKGAPLRAVGNHEFCRGSGDHGMSPPAPAEDLGGDSATSTAAARSSSEAGCSSSCRDQSGTGEGDLVEDKDEDEKTGGSPERPLFSAPLKTRRQLLFLLETLARELEECPLFYTLPELLAAESRHRSRGQGLAYNGAGNTKKGFVAPTVEAVLVRPRY